MSRFTLSRNTFGKLVFEDAQGKHEGVVPVRAFPIGAPDTGIAIVDIDGHELAWINRLEDLPADARALLQEELKSREFLPVIGRIRSVSTFAVPSTWEVETDRGLTSFVLKGEEDIRRIAGSALLVADSHGVQYLIRDLTALDKGSRKLLDRFL
ncbi:DUF1854 domain-containing protein [Noviherbaspirillum denitrificans]|uniref:DUF1854 domain-containing protein n=1 Tax=Noviherbaspirillum denitrificans TaxID=1968433 RepID=A0A254TBC3_9BURK|nr:DUF1854 domain-containing protein [Noviherbaspirillum denitrificans]OWW19956.1 hypothetical protein AYR66_11035 [Noviherbaspirillum denitrificans]